MDFDAVIKVGGSLSRGAGLDALCREIGRLAVKYRLLVVPGGGVFADQVREMYQRYSLSETAAHRMALLAMDQYGYLLNQLIPGSVLVRDLSIQGSGQAEVLLPSALVNREDTLPHSWEVTSDSIAAWIASRSHCRRLILFKDVDGLLDASRLIPELTVRQLSGHSGGVDNYLSKILSIAGIETWVINGLKPERLSELLGTSYTTGTRIRATN